MVRVVEFFIDMIINESGDSYVNESPLLIVALNYVQ